MLLLKKLCTRDQGLFPHCDLRCHVTVVFVWDGGKAEVYYIINKLADLDLEVAFVVSGLTDSVD